MKIEFGKNIMRGLGIEKTYYSIGLSEDSYSMGYIYHIRLYFFSVNITDESEKGIVIHYH